ncbi:MULTISPECIES: hypothetical protein [unclassified Mameliella]|uniref:hypothetical protein n=1 Tax=unclassified Mameliella TaxID=2630630 RepID=UPI00273D73AB|nr:MULTISPECIES: hypothetical protein [unclassified Mameliella]
MRALLTTLKTYRRALLIYGLLLLGGWLLADLLRGVTLPEMRPMNEPLIHRMVMLALAVYVVTSALPFVPGAEIGIALLLIFGGAAAPLVYGGMLTALVLSFALARLLPPHVAAAGFRKLGLGRFALLLEDLRATPPEARAAWLARQAPGRFTRLAVRNRYLLLIALINTPGNSLIGGGGGIAFLAGVSGLFAPTRFVAAVAIAVAPLPLVFGLFT